MKYFAYVIVGIVAVAVIAGFFVVGSPKTERLRKFDERRVNDLQYIQSQIINYWFNKDELPESLVVLPDPLRGVTVPKDPETGADYAYSIDDAAALMFSLCANFALASDIESAGAPKLLYRGEPHPSENWSHDAGQYCFERTIDRDFYKSQPKL